MVEIYSMLSTDKNKILICYKINIIYIIDIKYYVIDSDDDADRQRNNQ